MHSVTLATSQGDMSKPDAMSEFVKLLQTEAPSFAPWLAKKQAEIAEQERVERERVECVPPKG
jgi:hypothetical protein